MELKTPSLFILEGKHKMVLEVVVLLFAQYFSHQSTVQIL